MLFSSLESASTSQKDLVITWIRWNGVNGEDYDDVDIINEESLPEAAASRMEVEIMKPKKKLGPSLGRVLGDASK